MAEVIPAIIPKSLSDLAAHLEIVRGLVSYVQIDVCDGIFVSSRSWPYPHDKEFEKIVSQSEGLPLWQDFDFEIDLMTSHPDKDASDWVSSGATRLIFHFESSKEIPALLKKYKDPGLLEVGIAINIDTPNEVVERMISEIDVVQFMGIDHLGFQNEHFDEKVLSKIGFMRKEFPDVIISVDGGVHIDSAERLVEAGVDRLIAGSAIFGAPNPREAIDFFRSL